MSLGRRPLLLLQSATNHKHSSFNLPSIQWLVALGRMWVLLRSLQLLSPCPWPRFTLTRSTKLPLKPKGIGVAVSCQFVNVGLRLLVVLERRMFESLDQAKASERNVRCCPGRPSLVFANFCNVSPKRIFTLQLMIPASMGTPQTSHRGIEKGVELLYFR